MNDFEKVKVIIAESIGYLNRHVVLTGDGIDFVRGNFRRIHQTLFGCKPGAKTEEARPKKGVVDGS